MPIYEYQCQSCGHFEITRKITAKSLSRCPTCKGKVKKLISQTSFQLKGTGWYATDYARKDKASAEKAPNEKTSAESKSDGKAGDGTAASEKPSAEKKPAKTSASESASA